MSASIKKGAAVEGTVWAMGGAVGRDKLIFSIAESCRFLYWKTRKATEIVIGR